jgi:hypothetical protein
MNRFLIFAFVLFASAGALFYAAPAQAQATRTWVSGVGDDANPCSRTAPCKTFAGAISKTAAKGEINCIDPAGFGSVTITKSITIDCHNVLAGIVSGGANGIIVNVAATDKVVLIGLDINGLGTGLDGIKMVGAGSVDIYKSTIYGFTGSGVGVKGTAGAAVYVEDTALSNNLGGIEVAGAAGAANSAVLNNVTMLRNTDFSVKVSATGVAILNSSILAGSTASIIAAAGAQVQSYGNNVIRNAGLPTATLPLR